MYAIKKRLVARIKHGGCRHLEFRKTVAVFSIFDQISSNLAGMLQLCIKTRPWCRKTLGYQNSTWLLPPS